MKYLFVPLVACLALASPTLAATYYLTTANDLPGIGPEFDAARCFERTAGPQAALSCNSIRLYENDDNTFSNVVFDSFGSTAEGVLKTRASVHRLDDNLTELPTGQTAFAGQSDLAAAATAAMRDTFTLTGGQAGTVGTLRFTFAVDGVNSTSGEVLDPAQPARGAHAQSAIGIFETRESALVNQNVNITQQGTFLSYNSFLNDTKTIDQTVDLDLSFVYGRTFHFGISLQSSARVFETSQRTSGVLASTDFSNTARLIGVDALDASGDQISTLSIVSASGSTLIETLVATRNQEVANALAPIPLPAGLPLLLAGLGGLALLRRRALSGKD